MGGRQRLPIEVVQARGSKHLTKAEIQERQEQEIKPITDSIIAPSYLTKKQKDTFYKISEQLQKLKIMGETDADVLARYIVANDSYVHAHFDAYENDKRYSITIIYSDDDYKVEKFAYDVIVFKQDKEELSEVGEAGSIYSTKEGVFVYVNGDYQQLGNSNDFNWEPIKK